MAAMAAGIRTTRLKVTISEKDATKQVENDLLSFSYTDKETDEAEEVSITLKDEKGKWRTSWAPDPNAKLTASITSLLDGVVIGELPCGEFHVDSRRVAGAPGVYELRATSIPQGALSAEKRKSVPSSSRRLNRSPRRSPQTTPSRSTGTVAMMWARRPANRSTRRGNPTWSSSRNYAKKRAPISSSPATG